MKYETFDQPAYGVGDLETFGITDNSGSLVMNFSSDSGMESWRADSLLSEELLAYSQVSRAHEMGGDGGTIPPPPPPPPGGSDDDDTGTDDSSGDTSGSGDAGSGDDVEEDTVVIEQGYDPTTELKEALLNQDSPEFVYQTEFGKLMEDYSERINAQMLAEERTFSFGQIGSPQDEWTMQNESWKELDMGGGYTFGKAGCKATAGGMVADSMTGESGASPAGLKEYGYIDNDGNLSRSDLERAIETLDPQGRDVVSDYWEKQLDKDKILEIANENTYVLGRASLGSLGDEHWVVLKGGTVTDNDIIFEYIGSSKNDSGDPARTYTLNTEDESKRIFKINKIETFTFGAVKEEE